MDRTCSMGVWRRMASAGEGRVVIKTWPTCMILPIYRGEAPLEREWRPWMRRWLYVGVGVAQRVTVNIEEYSQTSEREQSRLDRRSLECRWREENRKPQVGPTIAKSSCLLTCACLYPVTPTTRSKIWRTCVAGQWGAGGKRGLGTQSNVACSWAEGWPDDVAAVVVGWGQYVVVMWCPQRFCTLHLIVVIWCLGGWMCEGGACRWW